MCYTRVLKKELTLFNILGTCGFLRMSHLVYANKSVCLFLLLNLMSLADFPLYWKGNTQKWDFFFKCISSLCDWDVFEFLKLWNSTDRLQENWIWISFCLFSSVWSCAHSWHVTNSLRLCMCSISFQWRKPQKEADWVLHAQTAGQLWMELIADMYWLCFSSPVTSFAAVKVNFDWKQTFPAVQIQKVSRFF